MKIRCTGINVTLADPIANAELIKKEIKKAVDDDMDVLIFPKEILTGINLKDIRYNATLCKTTNHAFKDLTDYCENLNGKLVICLEDTFFYINRVNTMLDSFEIDNSPKLETIASFERNINGYKGASETFRDKFYIVCTDATGQSSTDGVYSSFKGVFKNGQLLACSDDITFDFNTDSFETPKFLTEGKILSHDKYPYIPLGMGIDTVCERIVKIQGKGLIQRMKSMHRDKIIMGISGGLDSTVALLSCVEIFKKYNLPLENIIGITMPGLGTTDRTYKNALALMKATGITMHDIDLKPVLNMTIKNLGLADDDFGLTYQQTQSRERTQVLLDYANKENGIVIGTGCMSEFALGWMTYGGDHLSMYAIAVGLPKTLVKELSKYFLRNTKDENLRVVLNDIIETPVSPELAPVSKDGKQEQKTEKIIGDYILHDFFVYHIMNHDWSIRQMFESACEIFIDDFTKEEIYHCLETFVGRFFSRQYKKNCFAEGVQILDYSLSPRTSWKMPGDLSDRIWKEELLEIKKEYEL